MYEQFIGKRVKISFDAKGKNQGTYSLVRFGTITGFSDVHIFFNSDRDNTPQTIRIKDISDMEVI